VENPDYLLIGWVGDASRMGEGTPTTLTPNEQYAYMSMWSLMAAPLIFSGDMAKLDAFTLNVLCNHEVIEIDQDPLGKQARILRQTRRELVLVKVKSDAKTRAEIIEIVEIFRGKIVDVGKGTLSMEVTGPSSKLRAFEDLLRPYGVVELVRTGKIALPRG